MLTFVTALPQRIEQRQTVTGPFGGKHRAIIGNRTCMNGSQGYISFIYYNNSCDRKQCQRSKCLGNSTESYKA